MTEILAPFRAELMQRYPVSEHVNGVVNDGPECPRAIESQPPAQAELFQGFAPLFLLEDFPARISDQPNPVACRRTKGANLCNGLIATAICIQVV